MQHFFAIAILTASAAAVAAAADKPLRAGFAEADVTPEVGIGRNVYLAGYGHNRKATGVHDPIMARAVVLADGEKKIALVSIDVVGLMHPTTLAIRDELKDFAYVMVSSTHNHEGPDTVGIWGSSPFSGGLDPVYLRRLIKGAVNAVRDAEKQLVAVDAAFGTAEDESLLGDSRLPKAYDSVLRVLKFTRRDDGRLAGLLVQWNCHPEAMGSRNTQVTADFPAFTVAWLKKRYDCPVAYFTGTVGGLLAPPGGDVIKDDDGRALRRGTFEYTIRYGEAVGRLAEKAVEAAKPVALTPFAVSTRTIAIPLFNPIYRLYQSLGVIQRPGCEWTGDPEKPGERLERPVEGKETAVESEVACLRLGEVDIACIPGEIYPELVYGKFQEPAEPAADFPDAPLEKPVAAIMPHEKWLLFGLANDELGYIIPKRQWDQKAPFAYGRKTSQYGEINSVGPEAAAIIMRALERRVNEL